MRALRITLILMGVVLGLWAVIDFYLGPSKGSQFDEAVYPTRTGDLKVSAFNEQARINFVPGAYYDFAFTPKDSVDPHFVMVFRHDDPLPIKEAVSFKTFDPEILVVFIGWMMGISHDAGRTWKVWNANENLPGWDCCNYRLIEDVQIDGNGFGVMTFNPIPMRAGAVGEIRSHDFGRTWSKAP